MKNAQITLPRMLHGLFAALTDIYVGEIARRVLGKEYVTTTVRLLLWLETNAINPSSY